MAVRLANSLRRHLRAAARRPQDDLQPDAELLQRFLEHGDQRAFAAVVRRHGPMVLGVCRRVLRNHADADDAFQATFLVLVRKAASVRRPRQLGNWLYGVAYRTALHARNSATLRRQRELQAGTMRSRQTPEEWNGKELREFLDEALNCLPDNFRTALVLCDLEGKTRKQAAHCLGWTEGTVASRLARARALLARRLKKRGLDCSAGTLTGLVAAEATASVPHALLHATVEAAVVLATQAGAAGLVAGPVLALTEGVISSMFLSKVKALVVVLLALTALGTGVGVSGYPSWAAEQPSEVRKEKTEASDLEKLRRENERLRRENALLKRKLAEEQAAHLATQVALEHSKMPVQQLQADAKIQQALSDPRAHYVRRLKEIDDIKGQNDKLDGVWDVVSVEDAAKTPIEFDPILSHACGVQAPVRAARITFQGGTFSLHTGPVRLAGKYSFDSTAMPKKATLSITVESPNGEAIVSISGVYSLDGDRLKLSWGDLPPSQLAGLAGAKTGAYYTLRRAPPSKQGH